MSAADRLANKPRLAARQSDLFLLLALGGFTAPCPKCERKDPLPLSVSDRGGRYIARMKCEPCGHLWTRVLCG